METLKFSFSIGGEWLTKYIQDGVKYERKGYEWAEKLVTELLKPNGLDDSAIKRITQDIIIGRGRFSGNTADGTFSYDDESYGTPDEFFRLFDHIDRERKTNRQAFDDINSAWIELASLITGEISRDQLECRQNLQFKKETPLQEFLNRITNEEAETKEPYGFISPDGVFHCVEWGAHGAWAEAYINNSDSLLDDYQNGQRRYPYPSDYLVYAKGWLLLHNPAHGRPRLTAGDKPMTKAQREALYDYYIKAGREEEASDLYKKEDPQNADQL